MDAILKIYLPLYLIGFIVLVFVIPSIRVYRQTGINPFRFATNMDGAHNYIGGSMKVFILLLLMTVLLYSFSESAYNRLARFEYLEFPSLRVAGLILGHLSILGIVVAQLQMKQSWRIGIDYDNKTQLVTWGLFSKSRNPIFLFLLISLVGFFLILPNAITFAVLFSAYIVLHITMRLEEDFLQKQHGEAYTRYKNNVPRLIY
ncbi:isoprenylcysteine carboxylmethyltransferase family protein [Flavisolibacter sp. BT320]|nr:isoprenylcysteine carboxylmethyltransferase family protein [Flavisolibacter longurius]